MSEFYMIICPEFRGSVPRTPVSYAYGCLLTKVPPKRLLTDFDLTGHTQSTSFF